MPDANDRLDIRKPRVLHSRSDAATNRVRKAMRLMRHLLEYGSLGVDDRHDVRTAAGGLAIALREIARQRLRPAVVQSRRRTH